MEFRPGDLLRHANLGSGTVVADTGATVIVRFGHGVEECAKDDLHIVPSLSSRVGQPAWDVPLGVVNRLQAEAIVSRVSADGEAASLFGAGFEIGYNWLLGSDRNFDVSIGVGATRLFGGALAGAPVVIPTIRLINLGISF